MQAAMTMNTLGLGAAVRSGARVSAKKASVFGAPVVGKSNFAVRKTVAPHTVRVMAMAADAKADPIMEAPFKGIKDDLAARGPLYIDDFKQGISTKSLVREPKTYTPAIAGVPERSSRAVPRIPSATRRSRTIHSRYFVPFFAERARRLREPSRRGDDASCSVVFKRRFHVEFPGLYTLETTFRSLDATFRIAVHLAVLIETRTKSSRNRALEAQNRP
jgi:hypothetical protein